MLTNEYVVLQRLVVGPGEWEGIHSHPGNQIFVHIKGGEWSGGLGGRPEPGQWTGIHSHPGNQVYIHIKGGTWSERRDGVQFSPLPFSEAGSVGWIDATDIDASHDVGNTGDTTIEYVLVTIK